MTVNSLCKNYFYDKKQYFNVIEYTGFRHYQAKIRL